MTSINFDMIYAGMGKISIYFEFAFREMSLSCVGRKFFKDYLFYGNLVERKQKDKRKVEQN